MAKKKKLQFAQLTSRLNILFLITFLLFCALIFRLGFLQIVEGEYHREQTERQSVRKVSVEAPRGWMLDRNGDILVHNIPVYSVKFTDNQVLSSAEKEMVAERLSTFIDMDAEAILQRMNIGLAYAPQEIRSNLNFDEVSKIMEHLELMPGVDVIVDPMRDYPYQGLFSGFIGRVQKIPADDLSYYLAQGYRMDESVGISYLEKQYESQLRGKQGIIEVPVNSSMRPIDDPILHPGQRGNDLILTIDRGLQQKIEEVIRETIAEHDIVEDAFFVAMDPHTGEILGMSNDVRTVGAGKTSWAAGSTVKMATVLMGLHEGLVTPSEVIQDRGGMQIGNLVKHSWQRTGLGPMNALTALQRSSNVYMFEIGMRLARYNRSTGYYDPKAFDTAFYYFSQFGLGVKTGVDLPEGAEFDGYKSDARPLGLLADFMIGQYHNYTPLQLAVYASTLANGGYRMQPYLVKEIRKGASADGEDLGQLVMRNEPTVLNRIDMSEEHLNVVRRGMEMVSEGNGTASRLFGSFPVKIASKTGTAQTVNPDGSPGFSNTIFVGYAPADNPVIAWACVVPQSQRNQLQGNIAFSQTITHEILSYYFGFKEEDDYSELVDSE